MTRRFFSPIKDRVVCDFCLGTSNVRWSYECRMFTLPPEGDFPLYIDSGDWAGCDDCMTDLESRNYEGIGARLLVHMNEQLRPDEVVDGGSARWATRLLKAFVEHRTLGPVLTPNPVRGDR